MPKAAFVVLFLINVFLFAFPPCVQANTNCNIYDTNGNNIHQASASSCQTCKSHCGDEPDAVAFSYNSGASVSCQDASACQAVGGGDPHFIGFDGSQFDFHGRDGAFVNLYSDATVQVNAELNSFGIHGTTFMKSIGVKTYPPCNFFNFTSVPVVENRTWIAHVESLANGNTYDGSGPEWTSAQGGITLKQIPTTDGSIEFSLSTSVHQILVRKERPSLHLDIDIKLLTTLAPRSAHGILGQTLGWTAGGEASLAGDEMSYIVSGIFENDFAFNMFVATCG